MADVRKLVGKLFTALDEGKADRRDGGAALAMALGFSMLDDGIPKEAALKYFGDVFDAMERERARVKGGVPPRGEDFTFVFMPEAQAELDANPELAKAMKETQAQIRQALDGVATGKFANEEEAFASIGATPFFEDDDDDGAGHA